MRIRILKGFWTSGLGLTILGIIFAIFLTSIGLFTYYYSKYSRMIDARLSGHVLQNTTQIFSAPESISVGESMSSEELTGYLQRAGYRPQADENALGQYTVQRNSVDIPRPSSRILWAAMLSTCNSPAKPFARSGRSAAATPWKPPKSSRN